MKISDRRSLANIARELGHPVRRVAELEVRPEDGPPGQPRVTASLQPPSTEPERTVEDPASGGEPPA